MMLADRGQQEEALQHVQRAVDLQPRNADAQANLGILLARRGNLDGAVSHLKVALELTPDNARVRDNLGAVLALRRRKLDAEHGTTARRIRA
jgi:Flp pilus assembly protein TadD